MDPFKAAPVKPPIPLDLFKKVDIRIGRIDEVEDVEAADNLVKLTVSFGDHTRTILAGMKGEREDPKEIEGRQALFLVNLEPKKMCGETSQGMLLDIGYADGITPALAVPERAVPSGARVG